MSTKKKALTVGLAVISIGAMAAGYGTTSSTSRALAATHRPSNKPVNYANASGTIVWAAPPVTGTGLRKTLIDAFEKAYPHIKVKLQQQNTNTDTNKASLTTQIGGGSATPDVYMGDVIWPAQMAHSQLALPLDTKLPSSFWNRFANGLVKGATYDGHVWAAPFFADSGFLYYRKDLLQKAHLPVPTTWAQVKSESKTLQKDGYVKYGFVWEGASYEGLTCDFMEYLTDAGGRVLNSKGQPAIDSRQAIKALTFMRSLITSGVSPKATVTFQEPQAMNVFDQGNAAFLRNWTYAWANSQAKGTKVVGKVGVTTLPTFQSGHGAGYSTIGGWNLYVNPHTKNLKATLQFIDWMTGKTAQTILAKDFSELPTNKAVQNNPQVKAVSPVFNIVAKTHFVSRPSNTPNYAAISQALYQNVNAALSGSVSVKAALKQAQSQMESAIKGGL